jgi:LAO/AO transport system kinase
MAKKKKREDSALHVLPGIEQPDQVSKDAVKRLRRSRHASMSCDDFFNGIRSGNRVILSKAITLIESSLYEDNKLAQELIERCLPFSGNSIRIGITGVPGVGKSTFIEELGSLLTANGHKLAVLAIDPSSSRSRGSILGDKTRMEALSADENAFIRPSPSGGTLGGVARKTWESVILCESAGFDIIFIETVGVGQSETTVHSMVDFFLLLMLAGAGDELQGIKRGIMEMADAIIINKADGDNARKATAAAVEYKNALALFPPSDSGWMPPVSVCSARDKTGIFEVWDIIQEYKEFTQANGFFNSKRASQSKYRMYQSIEEQFRSDFFQNAEVTKLLPSIEKALHDHKISAYVAAQQLLDVYFKKFEQH